MPHWESNPSGALFFLSKSSRKYNERTLYFGEDLIYFYVGNRVGNGK